MKSSILRAVRAACLSGSAAAAVLASTSVYAAAGDEGSFELQEVVVTGSHLMRHPVAQQKRLTGRLRSAILLMIASEAHDVP